MTKERIKSIIDRYHLRKIKLRNQCAREIREIYNNCNHLFFKGNCVHCGFMQRKDN